MLKHLQRDVAGSPLCGFGKDQFAQLCKQRCRQPQQAVGHQQANRHHQQGLGCIHRCFGVNGHGVYQLLEQQRHAHVGSLGPHHKAQREQHAPLVLPQVGQQLTQRLPV